MSVKTIAVAGLTGALEHLAAGKDYASPALSFNHHAPAEATEHAYLRGIPVSNDDDASLKPKAPGTAGSVMGDVDSSEQASLCILERDGVSYISLNDETLVWDSMYPMRGAFHIWLLSRSAGEKLVFDPYGEISYGAYPYQLMLAAGPLSTIASSPAETTTRLNSSLGGVAALLALVTKRVEVGAMGGLVLSPIPHLTADVCSMAYRPFLIDLYEKATARGLLTAEEGQQLIDGTTVVALSREMLIDRGVAAI